MNKSLFLNFVYNRQYKSLINHAHTAYNDRLGMMTVFSGEEVNLQALSEDGFFENNGT